MPAESGKIGTLSVEMFPEELIALHQEVMHHPSLLVLLAGQADKDIYIQICEIAAYCGIIVHGDYTGEDMLELCTKLIEHLQKKRIIVVH